MSYCINPKCPNPENLANSKRCLSCGSQLLLRERYRVFKALGMGGFGATFIAHDEGLPGEPSCVIKQLRPSESTPYILEMARELFQREADTLGKIGNHPQIPRLLDYFEERKQFYLVQEYISGQTLQQEIKSAGVFNEVGLKEFLREILPLLQYIHDQKVIHRDIKPANLIRRSQDSRLVLIDFGAVKNQVSNAALNLSGQTALTVYAIGTPGFAPPEQMAMRPVFASDVYALGVTCIYLLTGKSPKDLEYNPTTGDMMWEQRVQIGDRLTKVLRTMLEVSVRNRYQSAQEVLKALEIEPYLDSLAQGLLAKPQGGSNEQMYNRLEESNVSVNSTNFDSSGRRVAQVAAAIRARRAKVTDSSDARLGGIQQHVVFKKTTTLPTSSNSSHGQKFQVPRRHFDTQSLLAAYLKGRRDFSLYNLSLLNLQGADLSGTNFNSSQLHKTNLQEAQSSE